jgi:hypothetical protein
MIFWQIAYATRKKGHQLQEKSGKNIKGSARKCLPSTIDLVLQPYGVTLSCTATEFQGISLQ